MQLTRRRFLTLTGSLAALASAPGLFAQANAAKIKAALKRTPVIWLQAQSCSGCSVSLLNGMAPDVVTLITKHISLNFHQTLCGGTGETLMSVLHEIIRKNRKGHVLIVEGTIPEGDPAFCSLGEENNKPVALRDWVLRLAENAKGLVAVGTCSSFGGIPAAVLRGSYKSATPARTLASLLPGKTVINIPGCPPHPDWIMGTLVHFLLKGAPELDEYNRPLLFYSPTVHDNCSHLADYKKNLFTAKWGDPGCLYELGCLGMDSNCDIPKRKWLGVNTCTGCGSGCIGCTEPVFPNTGQRGLYPHRRGDAGPLNPEKTSHG